MAASAPPRNVAANWIDSHSSEDAAAVGTNGLELKMSGMSLMSSFADAPGLSGSTVSTYSADEPSTRPAAVNDSIDQSSVKGSAPTSPVHGSSQQAADIKGFAKPPGLSGPLPSPIVNPGHSKNSSATSPLVTLTPNSSVDGTSDIYCLSRQQSPFQGDGPSMPFLRNESGNSRRAIDDSAEFNGGLSNFGSFDLMDGDNDGLLGLDALRDRAYSSPGPMARSFESAPPRGQVIGHHLETGSRHDDNQYSRRPRTVSRDNSARSAPNTRPPLSGASVSGGSVGGGSVGSGAGTGAGGAQSPSPIGEGANNISADRSLGGLVVPFTSGRNNESTHSANQSQESIDSRGFGVISRPNELVDELAEPASRRISIPTESGREFFHSSYMNQNSGLASGERMVDQSLSHKFGSMPTLSTHLQQQRGGPSVQNQPQFNHLLPVPPNRHVRSFSLGGVAPDHATLHDGAPMARLPPGMDDSGHMRSSVKDLSNRFPSNANFSHHHRTLSGDSFKPSVARRSLSMSHPSLSAPFTDSSGAALHRRNSQPNMGAVPGYYGQSIQGMHPSMPRRDSREFASGQSPVVASPEEMMMFGAGPENERYNRHERLVSPAPSPLHTHYGSGHNRLPSDRTPSSLSSPMSLNNMMMGQDQQSFEGSHGSQYGANSQHRHTLEEDLSHPLAGEHIEVPADHPVDGALHSGFAPPGAGSYMVDGSAHQLMQHSLSQTSVDKMSQHFTGFDSPHHLPTAGATLPSPKVVYNVKFKRTQRSFVLGPRINRDLKIGTYVKVEADRGEDLGIVVGKIPADKYNFSGRSSFRANSMGDIVPGASSPGALGTADLKCIIRLATHDEVSLLSMKRDEEEELLKICRGKVRQRGLPMNVVDAEYQFDRHKLTFFFEAEGRIDFRELVRDLFSMYKTRIWMQQLDKNVTAGSGAGMAAASPATTMIDYGTPIIAPASEFSDSFPMSGLAGEARSG